MPAALLAAAAAVGARRLWPGAVGRDAAWGLAAAWLLVSLSAAALLWARAARPQAFWKTFWTGVGLRLAALGSLMALCVRSSAVCAPALLCGYAAGLAVLLPWEMALVGRR
jgi:hypothetical protein